MSLPIQNYRSSTPGLQPPSLLQGQLFVNVADRILYTGDGSNNKSLFDGTQTPGVPGQGWFATPLSQNQLDKLYLANPARYGDKPYDKQVLVWNGDLDRPEWWSVEPGGGVAAKDVVYDPETSGLAAKDVQAAIDETVGLVKTAQGTADTATQKADAAQTAADKAQEAADAAKTAADGAQQTADAAKTEAATAQQAADKAQDTADAASTSAGNAAAAALGAQNTANGAKSDAAVAQTTANEAKTAAATADQDAKAAQQTADEATTKITQVKETADSALADANQAQNDATYAAKLANDAMNAARDAQTDADAANTAAAKAQTTADAAVVKPPEAPKDGDLLSWNVSRTGWTPRSDISNTVNSTYANIGYKDVADCLAEKLNYQTVYVGTGQFTGPDIVISASQIINIVGPHCPDGQAIAFIGSSADPRNITINGSAERIRMTDLVIEGALTIDDSNGRHTFDNVTFNGLVTLKGNIDGFLAFEDCTFTGGLLIDKTYTGHVGFVACDMADKEPEIQSPVRPDQVLFTQCVKFLKFPANATLSGENETLTGFSQYEASQISAGEKLFIPAFTPPIPSASGKVGQMCYDNQYVYICVAENTWKRSALTSW